MALRPKPIANNERTRLQLDSMSFSREQQYSKKKESNVQPEIAQHHRPWVLSRAGKTDHCASACSLYIYMLTHAFGHIQPSHLKH